MENEILKSILDEIKGIKTSVNDMNTKIDDMNTKIDGMSNRIDNTNTRIDDMQAEIHDLKEYVTKVDSRVINIDKETSLNSTLISIMSERAKDIQNRVILIENEHGKSLGALHNGYRLLYDIAADIRHQFMDIQSKEEIHDLELKILSAKQAK